VRGRLTTLVLVALVSLVSTAGGIAISLVTSDSWPTVLSPYRRWGWWIVLGLMVAAAGFAVWQARRQASSESGASSTITADNSGVIAGGDVSITGGPGVTAGRDATAVSGGQGPTAGRDIITVHNYPLYAPRAKSAAHTAEDIPGGISNLPPRNPNFTGRRDLLEELQRKLEAQPSAAVVGHVPAKKDKQADQRIPQALYGLGGIGKTQLALEYAYRYAHEYDITWWIPAEEPITIPAVLAELARRLGVGEEADQETMVAEGLAKLARRDRWLLIFDNARQPQDLNRYRPGGGGGHTLITSRNPTWGGIAARIRIGVFITDEAVAFLLHRTSSEDEDAARMLADELAGLPLALEQAAAYAEQTALSLREYLDRYRRRHRELLALGVPIDYPATVATTWQLNIDEVAQKTPSAIELLQLCAFLSAEAIPTDLVIAVPDLLPSSLAYAAQDELALDEAIGALHRYSLLERHGGILQMHRLVQHIVISKLTAQERSGWIERLKELLLRAFPTDPEEQDNWPRCGQLLPHVLAVASRADQASIRSIGIGELMRRSGIYLVYRGEYHAAREAFEQNVAVVEATYDPDDVRVAKALSDLGAALLRTGDLHRARERLESALSILQAAYGAGHPEVAKTLLNLGGVLSQIGDLEGARERLESALAIVEADARQDQREVARILDNLGFVLRDLGDLRVARQYHERALVLFETIHGPVHPEVAMALDHLGCVHEDLGDLRVARQYHERALVLFERIYGSDHPEVAGTLFNLGNTLWKLGDSAGARTCLERSLAISEELLGSEHPATQQAKRLLLSM
jgi:tetratricopeptide (TPR) repeat protein